MRSGEQGHLFANETRRETTGVRAAFSSPRAFLDARGTVLRDLYGKSRIALRSKRKGPRDEVGYPEQYKSQRSPELSLREY
jgi:hypothetical protein